MNFFSLIAILLSLAAMFGYLNVRYIGLPSSIGVMLLALLLSIVLLILDALGLNLRLWADLVLAKVNFTEIVMQGLLSFLLFAGAFTVNLSQLHREKGVVALLSTVGVLISTVIVGSLGYFAFWALNLHVSYTYCLLFGALISPTDPIAVLALLKSMRAPASLKAQIAGESLFNDGVGIVLFVVLFPFAMKSGDFTFLQAAALFLEEAGGGILFGLATGWIAYLLLKSIDDYEVEVLLTLALVSGGYAFASILPISAPLAIVVAGLIVGNRGRALAMSETTRLHVDLFWKMIDDILNTVLFILIGLEVLRLPVTFRYFLAGAALIPIVLVARFISVAVIIGPMSRFRKFHPKIIRILTWGGLRGAISIAMSLSLPKSPVRDVLVTATYCVVAFSILVQGLTVGKLLQGPSEVEGAFGDSSH